VRASTASLGLGALVAAATISTSAQAHIRVVSHEARYPTGELKDAPCGVAGGGPGSQRYTYRPGDTMTFEWEEYIDHPGHFRIAFDPDGDDDFVDPGSPDETYTNAAVLLDGIADAQEALQETQVDLPDLECDSCTLQLIQVMTDKQANGWGNDDVYHACVDLRLAFDGPTTGGAEGGAGDGTEEGTEGDTTGGSSDDASGCACATAPRPGTGALGLLVLAAAARRRRPRSSRPCRRG
jgi:MYXO-CTERM domain-containing protein